MNGTSAVYSAKKGADFVVTICISSAKFNPNNYWNGRWRSVWTATFKANSQVTLQGQMRVCVHYYEDGNVQLNTEVNRNVSCAGGVCLFCGLCCLFCGVFRPACNLFECSVFVVDRQFHWSLFLFVRTHKPLLTESSKPSARKRPTTNKVWTQTTPQWETPPSRLFVVCCLLLVWRLTGTRSVTWRWAVVLVKLELRWFHLIEQQQHILFPLFAKTYNKNKILQHSDADRTNQRQSNQHDTRDSSMPKVSKRRKKWQSLQADSY